ncbi:MAG: recombination protein NinG [Gammaproteobacteria bacterium]|nr:recombination protein NinG [Gammaproteobacteria bacterium]
MPVIPKTKTIKPKYGRCKCAYKDCRKWIVRERLGQKTCNPICALAWIKDKQADEYKKIRVNQEKKSKDAEKKKKAFLKERKEAIKSNSELLSDAQTIFNRMRRLEDLKEFAQNNMAPECISCRTTNPDIQYAGGHYFSVGARPELRFNKNNVHYQCNYHCNQQLSANKDQYKPWLIKKIGQSEYDKMKADHTPKNYTNDQLRTMKKEWSKECRELKLWLDEHNEFNQDHGD